MKSADLVGLAPKGSQVKMAERPYLAIDKRGQYGGDYAIDQKLFLIHAPEPNACAGPEWRRPCRSGVKVYDSPSRVKPKRAILRGSRGGLSVSLGSRGG